MDENTEGADGKAAKSAISSARTERNRRKQARKRELAQERKHAAETLTVYLTQEEYQENQHSKMENSSIRDSAGNEPEKIETNNEQSAAPDTLTRQKTGIEEVAENMVGVIRTAEELSETKEPDKELTGAEDGDELSTSSEDSSETLTGREEAKEITRTTDKISKQVGDLGLESNQEDAESSTSIEKGETKLEKQEERPFKFDDTISALVCRKATCNKMTNCRDGVSVICPACSPYSIHRWCCAQHLYEDLPFHWAQDCRTHILENVDETTILARQLAIRPFVPSPAWDSPERFRQAVYFSSNPMADYFIFADIDIIPPGPVRQNPLPEQYQLVRGQGELWMSIIFLDDGTKASLKRKFQTTLRLCLSRAVENPEFPRRLAFMIRNLLIASGHWSTAVVYYLALQMKHEMQHVMPMDLSDPYWTG